MSTVIARQVTKAVAPLMILVSINFFLQGHNMPGGGFIAGVMTSAAIGLIYVIFNFEGVSELTGEENRKRYQLVEKYLPLSDTGLLLAFGSGVLSFALGLNFLGHVHGGVEIPVFGKPHLTTALIFDLGVYLTVVGSLMTMLEVLGEE